MFNLTQVSQWKLLGAGSHSLVFTDGKVAWKWTEEDACTHVVLQEVARRRRCLEGMVECFGVYQLTSSRNARILCTLRKTFCRDLSWKSVPRALTRKLVRSGIWMKLELMSGTLESPPTLNSSSRFGNPDLSKMKQVLRCLKIVIGAHHADIAKRNVLWRRTRRGVSWKLCDFGNLDFLTSFPSTKQNPKENFTKKLEKLFQ